MVEQDIELKGYICRDCGAMITCSQCYVFESPDDGVPKAPAAPPCCPCGCANGQYKVKLEISHGIWFCRGWEVYHNDNRTSFICGCGCKWAPGELLTTKCSKEGKEKV